MDLSQPISSVMTRHPICLESTVTLREIDRIFERYHFRHLPVLDGKTLVGILSKSDFNCFKRGMEAGESGRLQADFGTARVKDVMSPNPVTLPEQATIRDAMMIFSRHDFHAIPIVRGQHVKGIFTTQDLIRLFNHRSSAPGMKRV